MKGRRCILRFYGEDAISREYGSEDCNGSAKLACISYNCTKNIQKKKKHSEYFCTLVAKIPNSSVIVEILGLQYNIEQ